MVSAHKGTPAAVDAGALVDSSTYGRPIVERAATILEEELATGPFGDLLAPRAVGDASPVSPVVDRTPILATLGDLLERLLTTPEAPASDRATPPGRPPGTDTSDGTLAIARLMAHGRAGGVVDLTIGLVNDDLNQPSDVSLCWTGLLAGPAQSISEEHVTIDPGRVQLGSGETRDVIMRIDLPPETASGVYVGLVRTDQPGDQVAIVTVQVD